MCAHLGKCQGLKWRFDKGTTGEEGETHKHTHMHDSEGEEGVRKKCGGVGGGGTVVEPWGRTQRHWERSGPAGLWGQLKRLDSVNSGSVCIYTQSLQFHNASCFLPSPVHHTFSFPFFFLPSLCQVAPACSSPNGNSSSSSSICSLPAFPPPQSCIINPQPELFLDVRGNPENTPFDLSKKKKEKGNDEEGESKKAYPPETVACCQWM